MHSSSQTVLGQLYPKKIYYLCKFLSPYFNIYREITKTSVGQSFKIKGNGLYSPPVWVVEPTLLIIYLHGVPCLLCVFYLLSIRYLLGSTWRSTYTGCSVKEIEIIYYLLQNELDYYTDTTANNTATIDTTATTDTTCTTKTAATSARTAAATTSTTDTTYTTVTSASTASTGENVTEFYVSLVSFFPRCWLELYRQ